MTQPTLPDHGKRQPWWPAGCRRSYGVGMTIDEPDYLRVNRANWDDRAPIHASSPGYEWQAFVDDPSHLSGVVRFDLPRLGDVAGLDGVHLQCHLGTDTISLSRLGARMTGLDLSGASLAQARRLAELTGTEVDYVESDVYAAPLALGGRTFDLVYVSLGALCWLPSVERWAEVVDALLRPGGRLFIRDTHPMLNTLDLADGDGDAAPSRLVVGWPYFETPDPVVWDEDQTYFAPAEGPGPVITHTTTHSWNHGIGETVTALTRRGLVLTLLEEHDSVPFQAFPGMVPDDLAEYRLAEQPNRVAMSFTLTATKPQGLS